MSDRSLVRGMIDFMLLYDNRFRGSVMDELLYRSEVFAIVGAAMEAHTVLGSGFLEAVYQEALAVEFMARQFSFESQKELRICYKGHYLEKTYIADFVLFGSVIVEIKALDKLASRDTAQLLNYLKATGLKVGVLINFGSIGKLEWKRFALTEK
jgi:GxxExxY protein